MNKEMPNVPDIVAFITTDKKRYLGGDPLALVAKDEEELQAVTQAIARALRADVLELKTGDRLIIRPS
jgi:hypothetical protein